MDTWAEQIAVARHAGSGPDGLADAVVDGSGRLVDLKLDPSLMRRTAGAATKEVLAAVVAAQDAARTHTAGSAEELESLAQRASADAQAYRLEARRQLDELNTLVNDLIRGRER
jgi:DNA-binding protein YbaB